MTKSFMEEHGSRWLLRASDQRPPHNCDHPPIEAPGDLWQCGGCDRHWLVDSACPTCVAGGHGDPPRGMHTVGLAWRLVSPRCARQILRRARRAR